MDVADDDDDDDDDHDGEDKIGGGRGGGRKMLNRLFGDANVNVLGRTDPVINIRVERVRFMISQGYNVVSLVHPPPPQRTMNK